MLAQEARRQGVCIACDARRQIPRRRVEPPRPVRNLPRSGDRADGPIAQPQAPRDRNPAARSLVHLDPGPHGFESRPGHEGWFLAQDAEKQMF